MKRRYPVIILIVAGLMFSLLYGCSYQPDSEEYVALPAVVNTTIAVVNADMGVEIDGERLNYSAAIIDALEGDFTLVSPAIAESGFESGAFGAIITFPSNVSERIVSFNAYRPYRVQLNFRINRNLSESDYIETHHKIMNLQVSINSTLAHTYVSSIFSQFHTAQGHINTVFQNNLDNLYSTYQHATITLRSHQLLMMGTWLPETC